jgi:hypothetical protein
MIIKQDINKTKQPRGEISGRKNLEGNTTLNKDHGK